MPDDTTGERPEPAPALTVAAEQADGYRQLALSAAIIGDALEELAQGAMMLGAPDPESLGAEGADWPNFENCGVILKAWARLVSDNLPAPDRRLIVVERKLDRPS